VTLISGTSAECLTHVLHNNPYEEVKAFTADFVGINRGTVRRWYTGTVPKGMVMLKVRVMLDMVDYDVEEYQSLPQLNKQLAQLIAFDVLSADDVMSYLKYTDDHAVHRIVLQGNDVMPDRRFQLQELLDDRDYQQAFIEAKAKAVEKIERYKAEMQRLARKAQSREDEVPPAPQPPAAAPAPTPPPMPAPATDVPTSAPSPPGDDLAHALVHAIRLTKSLVQAMGCSASSEDLRSKLQFALEVDDIDAVLAALQSVRIKG
jgi:hypothetical protein